MVSDSSFVITKLGFDVFQKFFQYVTSLQYKYTEHHIIGE